MVRWLYPTLVLLLLLLTACTAVQAPLQTETLSSLPTAMPTPSPSPTATPNPMLVGTPVILKTLAMADATQGWALSADNARVLRTTDGGHTWRDLSPLPPPAGPWALASVDAQTAWVIARPADVAALEQQPLLIWRTLDGGVSWIVSAPLPVDELEAEHFAPRLLYFRDVQTGWLLVHLGVGMNHEYVALFATTDGGATWARLFDPYTGGPQACPKTGLAFADAQTGWLTRDCSGVQEGAFVDWTTDGGLTWSAQPLPLPEALPLADDAALAFCSAHDPHLNSPLSGRLLIRCRQYDGEEVLDSAWIYETTDGGVTWEIFPCPGVEVQWREVTGWAWGTPALSLSQTYDGGRSWQPLGALPVVGPLNFVSAEEGWLAGLATPGLYHTRDGGLTWERRVPRLLPTP